MAPDDDDLQSLHLRALRDGRIRVARHGDAEALLWEAPCHRVVRIRVTLCDAIVSELHALLGADGYPVAWWQRSVAGAWRGVPWHLPVPHQTVYEITVPSGRVVADDAVRERCISLFSAELAQVAGAAPETWRHAWPACAHPAAADAAKASVLP